MSAGARRGALLSDFNISNLAGFLANSPEEPVVEPTVAPFGQAIPALLDPGHAIWNGHPAFAVVWTRPEAVIGSFRRFADRESRDADAVLREADAYAALLVAAADRVATLFVPSWTLALTVGAPGMLDLRPGDGLAHMLWRMNLRLSEVCAARSNIYLLDSDRFLAAAGRAAVSPTLWYMAKIPFAAEVFREAARSIKSALRGLAGHARKLVLLDLDETLWGGIVGEVGWSQIRLGGHDPIGEAYADFQRALKVLTRRGVILALVSKNEEAVALEAIRCHPEMVLREEDFVGWRINWKDKAANIADLVASLNLGLASAVFIDDHPAERARVREAFPEILVPDWPEDPTLFRSALQRLDCFDVPAISAEDAQRTAMYVVERRREALLTEVASVEEWLRSLGTRVIMEPLNPANLARTAQLLNKTNQMNLATRRLTEPELLAWAGSDHRRLWTFRVADRFGDAGLTGILGAESDGDDVRITDFLLSCRVMGRKVEETMLAVAVDHARHSGLRRVVAQYRPTERNPPCLKFFEQSGFLRDGPDTFVWPASDPYPVPACIRLERTS